ncbi:MAG: diguanylate cyclase [Candidatus Zixiibacteriota bacterium]|nr:MAG: diguanylate cyclase [candidate division Zixibacteria bacterium]
MSFTILVVDDSWESREVITSILNAQEDYNLILAENGQDAIRKLASQTIDLVITDISMPVMDGLELLDHLTQEKPELPVITYTGFGDLFGAKALERGAEDCVFKPFDARDFRLRVAKALKYSRLKKYQEMLEQKNEELRQLSITDQLTQIYNRRYLQEVLHREFTRARRYRSKLALLIADIDHFKKINDTLGHLQGDVVLRELAALIRNTTREVDIPFRFGGEEFLVLLPETDRRGAETVAERLRRAAEAMPVFKLGTTELADVKISLSIGLASFPDPRIRHEMDLVILADEALYLAKKQGRNCVMIG